jgi:hypothetical protein
MFRRDDLLNIDSECLNKVLFVVIVGVKESLLLDHKMMKGAMFT